MGTTTKKKAPTGPVDVAGATKAVGTSQTPAAFARGLLVAIHAPTTTNNLHNVYTWLANEQTTATNWVQNRGNPLGVQTRSAQANGRSGNVLGGVLDTAKTLTSGYPSIVTALRHNAHPTLFNATVVNSSWNGSRHYNGAATFAQVGAAQKANPTGWFGQWVEPIFTHSKLPSSSVFGIPGAIIAPVSPTVGTTSTDAINAGKSVSSTSGLISKISNPTNLKNVGIFVLGAGLAITGTIILVSGSKSAKMAAELGMKAA